MKITEPGVYKVIVYSQEELKSLFPNTRHTNLTHTIQIGKVEDSWFGMLIYPGHITPSYIADTPGKVMGSVKRFIKREQLPPC